MSEEYTKSGKSDSDKELLDKPVKQKMASASISQLLQNAEWIDYGYMFFGTIGGIVSGLSQPFFSVLFGNMLNALNSGNSLTESVNTVVIDFLYVAAANIVVGFLQIYCWTKTGERQVQIFRKKYVTAILSQEIGWFDTCGAGELSTKVADLTGKLQDGFGRKIGDLIQFASQVLGSFLVGFYLSWKLTVVLIAAIPFIAVAGAFMISAITSAQNQSVGQYAAAGGLATESLGAVRTVTALNAQPDVITKYRIYLFQAMQVGITKGFKVGLGNGMLFGFCFLTYALGFWYGAKLVTQSIEDGCSPVNLKEGCVTGGTVMSCFFSVIMGSMAIGQLTPPISALAGARAALAGMLEIISRKPLIDGFSTEGEVPKKRTEGNIELKNIQFAYPSRPDILVCKDYSLSIKPGETVALVGASGCGKSTIINLLLRFYDPLDGGVFIDDKNIRDLNIRYLRSQIGYVGQEPILFSGSIGDNIAYGLSPDIVQTHSTQSNRVLSKEELMQRVVEAAKLANAHDFISAFPRGYDTDVGSNGVAMSGGQKQRIAIARALIKKPAVLLLDEATSALDAASERIVQQSIDALQKMKAQTTIVIAHRLGTIRNADKICLISGGKIAEMGTHDELFSLNGLYSDLVRLQMSGHDDVVDSPTKKKEEFLDESKTDQLKALVAESNDLNKEAVKTKTVADVAVKPILTNDERKTVTSKIWKIISQHPLWMITGCFGAALFGAVFPVWGLILANSQNMFYLKDTEEMQKEANKVAIQFIIMGFVVLIAGILQFWGNAQVGERISSKLRSDMFEAMLRREITYFDAEENSTGNLTTRLSDESRIVHKAYGEALAKQIEAVFTLVIGLILGLQASWQVALVVMATFPISIAASVIRMKAFQGQSEDKVDERKLVAESMKKKQSSSKKSIGFFSRSSKVAESEQLSLEEEEEDINVTNSIMTNGGQGAVISTAFTHMRTVSAFSMQHKVAEQYTQITEMQSQARSSRSVTAGIAFGFSNAATFLTYALLFWYGSTLITKGTITFVQMMTAMLTLMLGAIGLGSALNDLGDQKLGVESAARIFKTIEDGATSSIDGLSLTGAKPSNRATGRIELKDVFFRYPTRPDVEVCKGYNFTIEPGQMVALVGPSGSGKSTIINLLLRFYDPISGDLFMDGVNIKDMNVRWLRSQIGYVGQEPVLFTGSVADNIAKGRADTGDKPLLSLNEAMKIADEEHGSKSYCCEMKPKISVEKDVENGISEAPVDQDVINACIASNAHDFIMGFPQKYDTDVGEGSIMVSGGQKQRIAIARALVKKPAVLLLDEATSALDAASERIVQQSIDALQQLKEQTTIVIAHRLSTIRNADKIIVVDQGLVVETGTHDQLLQTGGLYSQLWAKQSGTADH